MENFEEYMPYIAWGGVGIGAATVTAGIARDSTPAIVAGGLMAGFGAVLLAQKVRADEPEDPVVELTPSSHNYGSVETGKCSPTRSFVLKNTGGGIATGTVYLTGPHANEFQITSGEGEFSLEAGATKTISVRFCPTSTTTKSATLYADGSHNDDSASLSGNGVEVYPALINSFVFSKE